MTSTIQSDPNQMFGNNKIYGLDMDHVSADEIAEKVGVTRFKIDQLLYAVREGAEEAIYAFEQEDYERFWQAGLAGSPNGYEAYKRLKGQKAHYTTQFVEGRSKTTLRSPTQIEFWTDPVVIICLYNSLKKDGYYASA